MDSRANASFLSDEPRLPARYSAALIALLLAVAGTGTVLSSLGRTITPPQPDGSRIAGVYLPMLLVQAGLFVYVTRVGRPKSALGALVGRRWDSASRALTDLALAVVAATLIAVVERGWWVVTGSARPAAVTALLPHGAAEHVVWLLVAVSAGCGEEVVYRGYLQAELAALTRRPNLATVLQAALFALAHADQGQGAVARCLLYGLGLGALARARQSLLPGIVCHVGVDLAAAFALP